MNVNIKVTDALSRVSESQFCAFVGKSSSGDWLIYHRGHLAIDVDPSSSRLCATDRAELKRLAHRAMWAAKLGLVHLVQRRHGPHDYSYTAITRVPRQ
jgi:hypothetical protein